MKIKIIYSLAIINSILIAYLFMPYLNEYLKNIDDKKKIYENGNTIKAIVCNEVICKVIYKDWSPVVVNANKDNIVIINENILKVK